MKCDPLPRETEFVVIRDLHTQADSDKRQTEPLNVTIGLGAANTDIGFPYETHTHTHGHMCTHTYVHIQM